MAGCSDEENDTTVPQLGIDNSGVIFTAAGGTGTIELKVAGVTATPIRTGLPFLFPVRLSL